MLKVEAEDVDMLVTPSHNMNCSLYDETKQQCAEMMDYSL